MKIVNWLDTNAALEEGGMSALSHPDCPTYDLKAFKAKENNNKSLLKITINCCS